MQYFELKIELTLKSSIPFQKSLEPLSKLISTAIMNSSFKELHKKRGFKYYVFSNLVEISEDKVYKAGKNSFLFRTPNEKLATQVAKSLFGYEDNIFKTNGISQKTIVYQYINSLITLNPAFVTFTKESKPKFWTFFEDGDIIFLIKALHNNLVKKYESFYGEKLDCKDNFIDYFQIKNHTPQTIFYKGAKFFGNKFYIVPKSDEVSQKLAFMALSCGLGEKNSIGGGFCVGKGVK